MDHKEWVVLALVVLAGTLAYLFFLPQTYRPEGSPVDPAVFLEGLSDASRVYIVMDLRDASGASRQGVLQCGVDFAGSVALAGKNITALALEGRQCVSTEDVNRDLGSCLDELQNETILYIRAGNVNDTVFYPRAALIYVGENYALDTCRIQTAE